MVDCTLLAAGIQDWAMAIATVVGLIIYVLNQVLEAKPQQPQVQRQQPERRQRPVPPRPNRNDESQVSDFMREANQRRQGNREERDPQQQRQSKNQQRREKKQQQQAPAGPKRLSAPLSQESTSAEFAERSRQFAERVESDVSTSDVDSKIDDHIRERFSSKVGQLGTSTDMVASTADSNSTIQTERQRSGDQATALIQLLNNPQTLQQAFIMQMILERPKL